MKMALVVHFDDPMVRQPIRVRPGSSSPSMFALHDEHEWGSVCTFRGQRVLSFFYNTGVMHLAPALAVVIILDNL